MASLGSYLVLQHRSGSFLLCTFANTPGPIRDFEIHHTCFKFFSTRDDAGAQAENAILSYVIHSYKMRMA